VVVALVMAQMAMAMLVVLAVVALVEIMVKRAALVEREIKVVILHLKAIMAVMVFQEYLGIEQAVVAAVQVLQEQQQLLVLVVMAEMVVLQALLVHR
jgi:hypothetical protein